MGKDGLRYGYRLYRKSSQKTPLLRGSCLNPLGGVISTAPSYLFEQNLQLVSDKGKHLHSLACI